MTLLLIDPGKKIQSQRRAEISLFNKTGVAGLSDAIQARVLV